MTSFKIYALRNPITNNVFYVGKTTQTLKQRLREHISTSNKSYHSSNTDKMEYMQLIINDGLIPKIEIIEEIVDSKEAATREIYWITHFIKNGEPILNKKKSLMKITYCGLIIRLDKDLKDKLQVLADIDERKLSDWLRLLCKKAVKVRAKDIKEVR